MNIVAVYETDKTKIVCTTGIVGDFACYEGPPFWSKEQIASTGNKCHDEDTMRKVFCLVMPEGASYRH